MNISPPFLATLCRWCMVSCAFALTAVATPCSAATRNFPADSYQVNLQAVNDPYIKIDGTTVQLSDVVLIYGSNNATLVRSALTPNSVIRVEFDASCQVHRVWVLSNDEVGPQSIWEYLFGFTPPCSN